MEVVFVSHAKVTASTFGKGIPVVLPPQALQTALNGSPTTVDFAVGDTPFRRAWFICRATSGKE